MFEGDRDYVLNHVNCEQQCWLSVLSNEAILESPLKNFLFLLLVHL